MVNTKIRLIIFFAAKDGEVLYRNKFYAETRLGADCGSDCELIENSDLNFKKYGKLLDHPGMT